MPGKHELASNQPLVKHSVVRCSFARAVLLASLIAIVPGSRAAGLNYETTGFGTNYDQSGFPAGTTNFGEGSSAAGTSANDKAKEGKTAAERARSLGDMGNQIGKDLGKLVPLMNKARQQDSRSGSGSSQLNSLMGQRYLPPQPYRKPFEQLGLKTNKNLYVDGPPIRQRLLQEANSLNERSVQMFADASKANEAAAQMGKLGMESAKRGGRMGVARAPGSSSDSMAKNSRGAAIQSSGSSSQGGLVSGRGAQISNADISGKSEKGAESGSAHAGTSNEIGGSPSSSDVSYWQTGILGSSKSSPFAALQMKAATEHANDQPESAQPGVGSKLQNRLAYLDDMFNSVEATAGSNEPASAPSATRPADPSLEIGPTSLQVLNDLALPEAALFAPSAEFQGGGSLLEEATLFARVHQTLKRAEKNGRLVRSDR